MKRMTICLLVAMAFATIATPAQAAAPTNDLLVGTTPIAATPFSETIDTTEATTDADDVAVNTDCGAPATDASVWYTFTAAADAPLLVDVGASNYSAGVIVATGGPGTWSLQNCGPGSTPFDATSGVTYTILAFDDQFDGTGNGGSLSITVDERPPPPVVELTVNPTGSVNAKTGVATVRGTITCTGSADFLGVDGSVRQTVGRFTISGYFYLEDSPACDGEAHAWSATVYPENGKFAGGKAKVEAFAYACWFECGDASVTTTIRLRR